MSSTFTGRVRTYLRGLCMVVMGLSAFTGIVPFCVLAGLIGIFVDLTLVEQEVAPPSDPTKS